MNKVCCKSEKSYWESCQQKVRELVNQWFDVCNETLVFWFQILGEQPNQINNKNEKGFTPLHIACSEDLSECVVALLCAGKYLSEALIFTSTNPQYDERIFLELQVQ